MRTAPLALVLLATPALAQTWSPFPTPSTYNGSLAGSAIGLLSVEHQPTGPVLAVSEWDGNAWLQRTPSSSPPPRTDFALAYDPHRQRVVLYGGRNPQATVRLGDTWEWTGSTWQPQFSLSFPPARSGARMAYDSARSVMVLVGGDDGSLLQETWEYSAPHWQLVAAAPPPRSGFGFAYDPSRQRSVMFGGLNLGPSVRNDTWEWDGSSWTHATPPTAPSPRTNMSMAYDPYRQAILMFGGLVLSSSPMGATYFGDFHHWDGLTWTPATFPTAPSGRQQAAMALDPHRQTLILLGGYGPNLNGNGWRYPGNAAAQAQTFGTGCGMTIAPVSTPVLSQTCASTLQHTNPISFAFMGIGLSDQMVGPFLLPLPLDGYGLPGCSLFHDTAISGAEPCATNGRNQATYSFAVPASAGLVGLTLFLQGWTPDHAANPGGVAVSDALKLVIGSY